MHIAKLSLFILFTILYTIVCIPALLILYTFRKKLGPIILQFYSLVCIQIFGIDIEQSGRLKNKNNIIIIVNHTSYLDIFILSALYRTVYLSKAEVKHYPLIGFLAWLIGIIFIERDSPDARHRAIDAIAEKASSGIITIFPQGTTGKRSDKLPFRCGVFKTFGINPEIKIIPVTIYYKDDSEIAWIKDQLLIDNVKKVSSQKKICVKVILHKEISIDDYKSMSINEMCSRAENTVTKEFNKKYDVI